MSTTTTTTTTTTTANPTPITASNSSTTSNATTTITLTEINENDEKLNHQNRVDHHPGDLKKLKQEDTLDASPSSSSATNHTGNSNSATAVTTNDAVPTTAIVVVTPAAAAAASTSTPAATTTTATNDVVVPRVITEANSNTIESGIANLQKVVLEDIKLDEYYNETMEESTCKQFKFQITTAELKMMLDNSVLDTSTSKPYRYLTGSFIKIFEKHVELFEKQRIPIQKRNNIVYEESLRNNTVYLRVNGDCKLCPRTNRVKYVFTVKNRPTANDKFVEVEAKIRGTHVHGTHNLSHMDNSMLLNGSNVLNSTLSSSMGRTPQKISLNTTDKVVYVAKKRKINSANSQNDPNEAMNNNHNNNTNLGNYFSTQLANASMSAATATAINISPINISPNRNSQHSSAVNLSDKTVINYIVNQITNKIMIKLDQINLKVNQISDRLYDLERKLDPVEVAEIQF